MNVAQTTHIRSDAAQAVLACRILFTHSAVSPVSLRRFLLGLYNTTEKGLHISSSYTHDTCICP